MNGEFAVGNRIMGTAPLDGEKYAFGYTGTVESRTGLPPSARRGHLFWVRFDSEFGLADSEFGLADRYTVFAGEMALLAPAEEP